MSEQNEATPSVPDLQDVSPLDSSDIECMKDIKEVLEKHGKVNRFGLALLHKHFPVNPQDVLVEEVDQANRTLTQRVMGRDELTGVPVVDTSWHLGSSVPLSLGKCRVLWHVEEE